MKMLLTSMIIFVVSVASAFAGDAKNDNKGDGYIRVDLVKSTIGDVKFLRSVSEIEKAIGSNRIIIIKGVGDK